MPREGTRKRRGRRREKQRLDQPIRVPMFQIQIQEQEMWKRVVFAGPRSGGRPRGCGGSFNGRV
jgi:hypothetical protein